MKKIRILSLALLVVLCCSMLFACGGEEELSKITVNVKAMADGKAIIDTPVIIEYNAADGYQPSALDAIKQACVDLDYTYTLWSNDNSLESISGEGIDTYEMSDTMWWRCTINGVEPEEGTAGENAVQNNDTVVFYFEKIPDFDAEEK